RGVRSVEGLNRRARTNTEVNLSAGEAAYIEWMNRVLEYSNANAWIGRNRNCGNGARNFRVAAELAGATLAQIIRSQCIGICTQHYSCLVKRRSIHLGSFQPMFAWLDLTQ